MRRVDFYILATRGSQDLQGNPFMEIPITVDGTPVSARITAQDSLGTAGIKILQAKNKQAQVGAFVSPPATDQGRGPGPATQEAICDVLRGIYGVAITFDGRTLAPTASLALDASPTRENIILALKVAVAHEIVT